jgi:hypothetical protein
MNTRLQCDSVYKQNNILVNIEKTTFKIQHLFLTENQVKIEEQTRDGCQHHRYLNISLEILSFTIRHGSVVVCKFWNGRILINIFD